MDTHKKIKMTVEMDVTIPQALALQGMFEYWNSLAAVGSSRLVGLFVDGDGDFHPNVKITTDTPIPELTPNLKESAWSEFRRTDVRFSSGDGWFDWDPIAWKLHDVIEGPNE